MAATSNCVSDRSTDGLPVDVDGMDTTDSTLNRRQRRALRDTPCKRYYNSIKDQLAATAKPHLLEHLKRLGVSEPTHGWTVGRCHAVIHRHLRRALHRGQKEPVGNFYKLWAHGLPLDHLKTMTRKEAARMAELMIASKKRVA